MNSIPQQFLISGTLLFLLSLLIGAAIPVLPVPRLGVSVHTTGLQSGLALLAFGLMWPYVALSPGLQRATEVLAVSGLYAIFLSMLLAALWGASRALPIAGTGHQASAFREGIVTALIASGSLAITVAVALILWGLGVSKA